MYILLHQGKNNTINIINYNIYNSNLLYTKNADKNIIYYNIFFMYFHIVYHHLLLSVFFALAHSEFVCNRVLQT